MVDVDDIILGINFMRKHPKFQSTNSFLYKKFYHSPPWVLILISGMEQLAYTPSRTVAITAKIPSKRKPTNGEASRHGKKEGRKKVFTL